MNIIERRPRENGKMALARRAFEEMLAAATRRGFYGTVQDGHVQHVRVRLEKSVE